MKFVTTIPRELIHKYTEIGYSSERIHNTTTKSNSLDTKRTFRGFVGKAVDYLLTHNTPVGNLQSIKTTTGFKYYIAVKNTKETTGLFETFKKLGINLGALSIMFDDKFENIQLSDKLVKDLKRYEGSEMLSAITMYIISLAHFYQCIYSTEDKFIIDLYLNQVMVPDTFKEYFYAFEDRDYTVEFKGMGMEDFESIAWKDSPYATYTYANTADIPYKYNFVKVKDMFGEPNSLVLTLNIGTRTNVFQILESGVIFTNMELNYFELQNDSTIRAIIPRTAHDPVVRISSFEGSVWETCTTDEMTPYFQAAVADILTRVELEEGISKEELEPLKITVKGSGVAVDPTAVKAQYVDDDYAQQLYAQVQDYYEEFDMGTTANLVPGFAKGDIYAMLFTGDSGTGKSTTARVIPYKCGIPYVSVNFSTNIEEADLFGSMIPNPTKKDPSEPEFIWQDGIITKAIRNGYCAILEEVNFARPGVLGKLNSLLDENRQIDLPNGEIVKAHSNFRMIATCNIAYEGTNRLNKAFINRFEQVINFENPDLNTLTNIIKSRTGYNKDDNIVRILDAYCAIRKYSDEQNLDLIVSVRQLITLFRQGKYYKSANEAVENIIINGAFIEVPEHAEVFKKSVLPAMDLKFRI